VSSSVQIKKGTVEIFVFKGCAKSKQIPERGLALIITVSFRFAVKTDPCRYHIKVV
jgi:hypothetical protein